MRYKSDNKDEKGFIAIKSKQDGNISFLFCIKGHIYETTTKTIINKQQVILIMKRLSTSELLKITVVTASEGIEENLNFIKAVNYLNDGFKKKHID